jgi:hypothetical protein
MPEKLPLLLTLLTYIPVGNASFRFRSNRLIPAYSYFIFSSCPSWLFFQVHKTPGKLNYGLLILDRETHMAFIQALEILADAD